MGLMVLLRPLATNGGTVLGCCWWFCGRLLSPTSDELLSSSWLTLQSDDAAEALSLHRRLKALYLLSYSDCDLVLLRFASACGISLRQPRDTLSLWNVQVESDDLVRLQTSESHPVEAFPEREVAAIEQCHWWQGLHLWLVWKSCPSVVVQSGSAAKHKLCHVCLFSCTMQQTGRS